MVANACQLCITEMIEHEIDKLNGETTSSEKKEKKIKNTKQATRILIGFIIKSDQSHDLDKQIHQTMMVNVYIITRNGNGYKTRSSLFLFLQLHQVTLFLEEKTAAYTE